MKQKILFVSHCFLNDGAKLKNQNLSEMERERKNKREFLKKILDADIEIIQLPCPEFICTDQIAGGMRCLSLILHFFAKNQEKC